MIFALGFLAASLIALAAAPAFWHRAIRLSSRRLEAQLPVSREEILADRDFLRAEFAVECRRLEQKVQALNELRAGDMAELGRRAATLARQEAERGALSQQNRDLGEELAEVRRAFAEASAELAAIEKDSYDTSGLISRKDFEIRELKAELEEAKALAVKQQQAIEAIGAEAARLGKALAAETAKAGHLEAELSTLRLQHQADQVTLKAAAARVADREEALEGALKREKDLIRHRKLQAETARAAEAGYLEKIERLRSANAAAREELAAARRTADRLAQELAALRAVLPPQDIATVLMQREENEVLRQKISEIGATVIRAAGGAAESASQEGEKSLRPEDEVAERATA